MTAITLGHGGVRAAMLPFLQQSSVAATSRDSLFFGVSGYAKLLNARSFYRVPEVPSAQDRLCFDVSNNRIACSINQLGLLERFAIELGVAPIETKATPVGAYVEKLIERCGPIPLLVAAGDSKAIPLEDLGQPEIHLQDDLFPRFEWIVNATRLRMLVFAPQIASAAPRAIFVRLTASSLEPNPSTFAVSVPLLARPSADRTTANGRVLLMVDSGRGWFTPEESQPIAIRADEGTVLALLFDATDEELQITRASIATRSANAWFDETTEFHLARYGQLSLSDAPFYGELYVRAAELTRQSLLLEGDDRFGGSFNGSDLPVAANVWMRDCFYSCLPQSFLCPQLARGAIEFFLDHGVPSHMLGEHADRFPGARGVTNSLGNSVAGIVLAGMYYQYNEDRQFFLDHPATLERSLSILNQVLASRREDVFLFPSVYVSDGYARGDFHTGSNIFLWRAFVSIARLAREVYGLAELAAEWQAYAQRLREAILANCIVIEDGKPRFVEAAMQDHTRIGGHDGEESDVTLAAFYDFCAEDDPLYLNAAHEALMPSNPYAIANVDGIWWYAHGKWSSATFPGWITALAGSQDEAEMLRHLERIRTLTDADGSFWWWPYPHEETMHPEHPLRTNSKCGWAAGVYVCFFTRHLLGLSADAPRKTLRFRPWIPWSEFAWSGCRIGSIMCDCSYKRTDSEVTVEVRNHTAHTMHVSLGALLPEKSKLVHAAVSTGLTTAISSSTYYGRVCAECSIDVNAGDRVRLTASFTAA